MPTIIFRLLTLILLTFANVAMADTFNGDGETIPSDEPAIISHITDFIEKAVLESAKIEGHAFRDAHRKNHGCVRAEFTVLPLAYRPDLKVGLFAEPNTYSAIIRFSNGSGQVQDDRKGDGRGMSIKILEVAGAKIDSDEMNSQDFLMINHPTFFVADAYEYLELQDSIFWWALAHPIHAIAAAKISLHKMLNPLESRYWSMTPSKYGEQQIKFSVYPTTAKIQNPYIDDVNLLSKNLQSQLFYADATFDFKVQVRTHKSTMPIEDPTVDWNEWESPFQTVAQIRIPPQQIDLSETCENLSFNPWHSLPEHRPLGGISRVRRQVYKTISEIRHNYRQ